MVAVWDFDHGIRNAKLINYFVQEKKSAGGGEGGGTQRYIRGDRRCEGWQVVGTPEKSFWA